MRIEEENKEKRVKKKKRRGEETRGEERRGEERRGDLRRRNRKGSRNSIMNNPLIPHTKWQFTLAANYRRVLTVSLYEVAESGDDSRHSRVSCDHQLFQRHSEHSPPAGRHGHIVLAVLDARLWRHTAVSRGTRRALIGHS